MQADTRMVRQLVRGFAIVAIVIVCVGIFNLVSLGYATQTYAQRDHDNLILKETRNLHTSMLRIVSATRGFIITGLDSYLVAVDNSTSAFNEAHRELQALIKDNNLQQRRLELIKTAYDSLVLDLETPLIEFRATVRDSGYSPELVSLFLEVSTRGRYLTDEILRLIQAIEEAESQALALSEKRLENMKAVADSANIVGPLVVLLLLLFTARINILRLAKHQEERTLYETRLQMTKDRLSAVIEGTHAGTWEWDVSTGRVEVNERWAAMLGYTVAELEPVNLHTLDDSTEPEHLMVAKSRRQQVLAGDMEFYDIDLSIRHKDGRVMWFHDRGKVAKRTEAGEPLLIAGTRTDITRRRSMQDLLDSERERMKATLLAVADGVLTTDSDGRVMMMNQVAERLTGWSQAEAAGRMFSEIFKVGLGQEEEPTCIDYFARVLAQGYPAGIEDGSVLFCRDGSSVCVEGTVSPIYHAKGQVDGTVLVFNDVTGKKIREEEYVRLSYRDPLTGLHNRRYYDQKRQELDAERFFPLAVVSADVDGLKLTNDAFGHEMGDRLLQLVGETLQTLCRKNDVVARVGGDEFMLLLPNTTLAQASQLVGRLTSALQGVRNKDLTVSVSFGSAVKEDSSADLDEVVRKAEELMYQHKSIESPKMKKRTVEALLDAQFQKDPWEYEHCMAVSMYAEKFARLMGFSEDDVAELKTAGIYHDIGKIAIDSTILTKTTALNEQEWEAVRRHSELSYSILRSVTEYAPFAKYVLHHHERWDGQGYPHALSGEAIPLKARMLTVVDAYVAMVSDRSYRKALSVEYAVGQLRSCAGNQFDPKLARAFVEHVLNLNWL